MFSVSREISILDLAISGYDTLVSFRESGGRRKRARDVSNVRTVFVLMAGGLLNKNRNALFLDLACMSISEFCHNLG